MAELKRIYKEEVVPKLTEKFGYKNVMQVPKVTKVVLNMGVGEAVLNSKAIDGALRDMTLIAGQKPVICRAKKIYRYFQT